MKHRLYSLFMKTSKGWQRASVLAFPLDTARRHYQTQLINGSMQGMRLELRPLTPRMLAQRNGWTNR